MAVWRMEERSKVQDLGIAHVQGATDLCKPVVSKGYSDDGPGLGPWVAGFSLHCASIALMIVEVGVVINGYYHLKRAR